MGYYGPMNERRLPDGRLLVQLPGEGPDGETVDGLTAIGPEHPDFQLWDEHLTRLEGQA